MGIDKTGHDQAAFEMLDLHPGQLRRELVPRPCFGHQAVFDH